MHGEEGKICPMPELAEVEFYRARWDCGMGRRISAVAVHQDKRVFRERWGPRMAASLAGSILQASEARGKQMLFRFSKRFWLGLHLGMTGELRVERPGFQPAKHDHLVLYQKTQALVFSDPRLFGRIRVHQGAIEPPWWASLPPSLLSDAFTLARMEAFLNRHPRLSLKAILLRQDGFPGIGNWMADEILWRARTHPRTPASTIQNARQRRQLWKTIRFVAQAAMKHISKDFSDPPRGWFFHQRWENGGKCPRHRIELARHPIAGRTTAWCPKCQPEFHCFP